MGFLLGNSPIGVLNQCYIYNQGGLLGPHEEDAHPTRG